MKANANPNLQRVTDSTPLFIASQTGHIDAVTLLLKANASANLQTVDGATPLIVASLQGYSQIVELLLASNVEADYQIFKIGIGIGFYK